MSDDALVIEGLAAGYGELTVLRDVSLTLRPGELTLVGGPNGAGKSTLLRALLGAIPASAGSALLGGEDLLALDMRARLARGLSIVPEGRGLFPSLTVRDNLRVALRAGRAGRRDAQERVDAVVAALPIVGERMDDRVGSLSGGQQQMVAVGRALLMRPRVLLLDEPSIGLAPIVWRHVLKLCRELADEGRIVLLVEQRVLEALDTSDRCAVLQQGRIVHSAAVGDRRAVEQLLESYFASGSAAA
ncbi:ABC transporter ATP-binding protein [Conexibacter stalactiti]|uniref:ABC transporter ATP-binding protein n=1 Tax=Conexibacter stalactiti TaxID=1940611 RepID=A0ABU4HSH5_9ACTN|nr:ABC transporter ATP-binding protein [Conexibacter stalactiti]MDW5596273.1 ABC transporter ATP-binding protein [Conexibacter stalactiti]MEC5036915.1 ABC transporter ATP-binding protein [Conexibacter stalactiti]